MDTVLLSVHTSDSHSPEDHTDILHTPRPTFLDPRSRGNNVPKKKIIHLIILTTKFIISNTYSPGLDTSHDLTSEILTERGLC